MKELNDLLFYKKNATTSANNLNAKRKTSGRSSGWEKFEYRVYHRPNRKFRKYEVKVYER